MRPMGVLNSTDVPKPGCAQNAAIPGWAARQTLSRRAVAAVRPVGSSLREPIVVGRDGLEFGLLEADREPAIDDEACGDVGDREALAHDVGARGCQVLLEHTHLLGPLLGAAVD